MANEPTKADLQKLLTDATNRATKAEGRVETLTSDLASANERADQYRKRAEEAEKRCDVLEAENGELGKSLRAYKGSATKARAEVTVLKRELSPQARKIGAMRPARNEDEAAERAVALEAAIAGGPTELVFSDGRRELRELAPLAIGGDAWRQTPHHRELIAEPILEPLGERQELELAGFALLNETGEQVGWCPLPTPIVVLRGQKMRIPAGSIRF